jgi:hypothetical protein
MGDGMIGFVERALERLDMDGIARDVMGKLFIEGLELYFIVKKIPRGSSYDFLGMAYSKETARKEAAKVEEAIIFELDMGEIVEIMQRLGGLKRIV